MIIVCWNMQGTGYASADMFALLVSKWGADVVIMLEPPDWAHNTRILGSGKDADATRWRMDYWRQAIGSTADRHHGSITTLSAPGVTVRLKGELYPDSADHRLLAVLKITKGDEVRRVATCHAPFGGGAYVAYVKNAVKDLAQFSETPRGGKKHIHSVDIWIGDLNTAGDHSPDDRKWVLKFARPTTKSGAADGSPRDKVLVRAGSDLVERARAGRVIGRNAKREAYDWQITNWDIEASSDHAVVYIDTIGVPPAPAAAVAAAAAAPTAAAAAVPGSPPRRSLQHEFATIVDQAKRGGGGKQ